MREASKMTNDVFEFVRDNMGQTPFHQWLLPKLVAVDGDAGTVSIELTIRPEFWRLPERSEVHGGIVAALVDIAGHATVAAKVLRTVATIDMRVDYLRLAGGDTLYAVGSVVKVGRTIGVVDVRLTDDQGRVVAVGRASYLTATK
jgi:uncharacterized protein (TIGR00369 family)